MGSLGILLLMSITSADQQRNKSLLTLKYGLLNLKCLDSKSTLVKSFVCL